MFEILILFVIIFFGTYRIIQAGDWRRAIKIAAISFVIAIIATALLTWIGYWLLYKFAYLFSSTTITGT